MHREPLELYIHIPFCVRKCQYCDFLSFGTEDDRLKDTGCHPDRQHPVPDSYVDALCMEMQCHGQTALGKRPVTSVFFGGGTPSLLSSEQLLKLMKTLRDNFNLTKRTEITMEANPGTLTPKRLEDMHRYGINRLSIGLQSVNDKELEILGRIHSFGAFRQSFRWAREAGFNNINIDLITAVPSQTVDSWRKTLETVTALRPEHISAYSLIIEEGTAFEKLYDEGKLDLPSEEDERQMYHYTRKALKQLGYERYEISNYAKAGKACQHNIGYWERKDYLGMGLGAASLLGSSRLKVTEDIDLYQSMTSADNAGTLPEGFYIEEETLDTQAAMEEFMFLGLRMTKGVSEKAFERTFHQKIMAVYGSVIKKHIAQGLLARKNGWISLTEKGMDLANVVMSDFLMDE